MTDDTTKFLLEEAANKLSETFQPAELGEPTGAPKPRPSRRSSKLNLSDCLLDPDTGDLISSTSIVIKNIPFSLPRDELLEEFTKLDVVKPFALNYHLDSTGSFKGLAFANFHSVEDTKKALLALNNHEINGRRLRVESKKIPLNKDLKTALKSPMPEDKRFRYRKILELLKEEEFLVSVTLSSSLSKVERISILELAEDMGLYADGNADDQNQLVISLNNPVSKVIKPPPNLSMSLPALAAARSLGHQRRFSDADAARRKKETNSDFFNWTGLSTVVEKPLSALSISFTTDEISEYSDRKLVPSNLFGDDNKKTVEKISNKMDFIQ